MNTAAVLAALLALFAVLVAATAALIYREPHGRQHLHMRTRIHLGRRRSHR
jgi:hypothetical protein